MYLAFPVFPLPLIRSIGFCMDPSCRTYYGHVCYRSHTCRPIHPPMRTSMENTTLLQFRGRDTQCMDWYATRTAISPSSTVCAASNTDSTCVIRDSLVHRRHAAWFEGTHLRTPFPKTRGGLLCSIVDVCHRCIQSILQSTTETQ